LIRHTKDDKQIKTNKMKKLIIMLAIAISTVNAFAGEVTVNQKVLDAFKTEFSTATDVQWSVGANYYMATFNYNEKYVFAYFSEDGELFGITRHITQGNLPMNLQSNLKKNYDDYWVTDLVEVSKSDGTYYYITLENADTQLVLKSSGGSTWSVNNKVRKS